MILEYNIYDLYRLAFGHTGMPYPAQYKGDANYTDFESIYTEALDIIGKPLFMPTKLGEVWLPNAPVINVTAQKRIVQTPVTGRRFTVKEIIHTEDYRVNIKGVAVNNKTNDFPYDIIGEIHSLFELNERLQIRNPIVDLLGFYAVVIESLNITPIAGVQNACGYEMNVLSDDDFIAVISD